MTTPAATFMAATAPFVAAMTILAIVVLGAMLVIGTSFVVSWARSRSASASLGVALKGDDDAAMAAIRATPVSVLALNDSLRRQADDVLARVLTPKEAGSRNVRSGQAVKADIAGQSAFANIDETLANLPKAIPEDDANPPQKACMESLAETLAPMREPFRSWSTFFKLAAEELAGVVPMDQKLPALLGQPLQAKVHFERDLYEQVKEVRARANDRDGDACGKAIEILTGSVVEWVHLTKDWYSLRQDAAAHICRWDSPDKPWHGWLAHLAVRFDAPETGRPMVWWQSGLLSQSDSLERLSAWIVREIDDRLKDRWKGDSVSAICSMSSTGVVPATLLSAHYRKKLLIADEGADFAFPPAFQPKPGDNVLLVDSNLSTGVHLERCARRLADAGAFIVGVVLICEDDLPGKVRKPIVETLRREERLIRLFSLSDMYNLWLEEKSRLSALVE